MNNEYSSTVYAGSDILFSYRVKLLSHIIDTELLNKLYLYALDNQMDKCDNSKEHLNIPYRDKSLLYLIQKRQHELGGFFFK